MILFWDKDVQRSGKEFESGWNYTQRRNSQGSGKIELRDYPTNARFASLYKDTQKYKDVLIEENSRNGKAISTTIKTLEVLFEHYRVPENWHGWDGLPLSYVLSDIIYGFETTRKNQLAEFVDCIEQHQVAINKLYDGDIHLDYFTGVDQGIYFYQNGYITFNFDCGDSVSQRWIRWVEDIGEKVYIGVQSVSSDVPFTAINLPNFAGIPVLTRRTGVEDESALYGVKIASDKRYVAVRFNLYMVNYNKITDSATNSIYDAEGVLIDRTVYGFTPVLRAFEVISRKTTEFELYDAPAISALVDGIEFGGDTLWDALKKLNEKYTFDFRTFIDGGSVYFQFASSLITDKTRKAEYTLRQGDTVNPQLNNTSIQEITTKIQKINVLHCYGSGDKQEQVYARIPPTGTYDGLPSVESEFSDSNMGTVDALAAAGLEKIIELRGDNSPEFDVTTQLDVRLRDKVTIVSPSTATVYDAEILEEDISYKASVMTKKFGIGGFRYNPIDALVRGREFGEILVTPKTPFGIKIIPRANGIILSWDGAAESYVVRWGLSGTADYNMRQTKLKVESFDNLIIGEEYIFSVSAINGSMVSDYCSEITSSPISSLLYRYSVDGNSFHDAYQDGDVYFITSSDGGVIWTDTIRFQGPQGNTGSAGKSIFSAIIFLQSSSAPSAPEGGSFDFSTGTLTPPTDWLASLPIATTTPTYCATFVFVATTPGATVAGGDWSQPVIFTAVGADGTTFVIKAAINSYLNLPASPATGDAYKLTNAGGTDGNGKSYVAEAIAYYTGSMWISLGTMSGPKGDNGTTYYLYVRYSAYADGTAFGTPGNTYIGTCVSTSATAPTLKTAYTWVRAVGRDAFFTITNPNETSATHDNGTKGLYGGHWYIWTATDSTTGFWTLVPEDKALGISLGMYFSFDEPIENADGSLLIIDNSGQGKIGTARNCTIVTGKSGKALSLTAAGSYIGIY